jgi:hypothetical protein
MNTVTRTKTPLEPSRSWTTVWGDRGVSVKILTVVTAAGAVAATVGVMGISALGTSAQTTQEMYDRRVVGISALDDMIATVHVARRQIRDVALQQDPSEAAKLLAGMTDLQEQFHDHRDAYAAAGPAPEKLAVAEEAGATFDEYVDVSVDVLGPLAIANDMAGFFEANKAQGAPVARRPRTH